MTNRGGTMKIYRAADAPPGGLAGESVAVLGYGCLLYHLTLPTTERV
jgi:hypothetical protein